MYRGAMLVYDCNPGYALEGETSIHCDGRRWSTAPPACVIATENPEPSCDFESSDLCGWSHDTLHDFDWKRNQYATPSGHVGTGPAFDHTFGEGKGGFYLFIEASSPRKINDTARLFSPVYPPELSGGCFTFWYHMYGATTGGLRVYLKPESHVFDELKPNWEKYGEQGNQWLKGNMIVPVLHENFQIVIEGIRGESYVGDSAIDDVRLTNSLCDSLDNSTDITENTVQDSCRGRCREADSSSSCGCNDSCFAASNCCSDYFATCGAGNETAVQNPDETSVSEFISKTNSPVEVTTITKAVENTEDQDDKTATVLLKTTVLSDETTSATSQTSPVIKSTTSTTLASTIASSISTEIPIISSTFTQKTSSSNTPTTQSTKTYTSSSTADTSSTLVPSTRTTSLSSASVPLLVSSTSISYPTTVLKTTVTSTTLSTSTKTTSQTTETQTATMGLTTTLSSTDVTSPSSTLSASSSSSSTSLPTTFTFDDSTSISTLEPTSTTTSSSSMTTLTSTRKTYNLRPRSSTTTPIPSTTSTKPPVTQSTTILSTSTDKSLKEETTTGFKTTSDQPTTWHRFTIKRVTFLTPSTPKKAVSHANSKFATQSTTLSNQNRISTLQDLATTESYLSDQHRAETATSTSKMPIVIAIVIIVVILAVVAVAYYVRKQRNRRRSKLSDDSEMRFLPESEFMEYSDASALDKILSK